MSVRVALYGGGGASSGGSFIGETLSGIATVLNVRIKIDYSCMKGQKEADVQLHLTLPVFGLRLVTFKCSNGALNEAYRALIRHRAAKTSARQVEVMRSVCAFGKTKHFETNFYRQLPNTNTF